MEPNRKNQKYCPVCVCDLMEGDERYVVPEMVKFFYTCPQCGYTYMKMRDSHYETIGMHTITWKDRIYLKNNQDLLTELNHLRNTCLAEAKNSWLEDKSNMVKTRGVHTDYSIIC